MFLRKLSPSFRYTPGLTKTLQQIWPHQWLQSKTVSSFDYMKRSKIPTYHFQKSLPRLPIPKLEDTCRRYLLSQKVLLNDSEFQSIEAAVKLFQEKEGPALQGELIEQDNKNKQTSYVSRFWFDKFLKERCAVVLNWTPFLTLINDHRPEYNEQLLRSTNLIVSSVRFMKTLEENILEPGVFHLNPKKSDTETFRNVVRWFPEAVSCYGANMFNAYPLDMSQYKNLFRSTRIPKPNKDELLMSPESRHLLVMRKGHFYSFDVLDENGNIKPANEILAHLKYISEDSRPPAKYPVGILSTENRDTWANLRSHLLATGNEETLKMVDSAVSVISLDSQSAETPIELIETFLHGDGTNRWFDKSVNTVITSDGRAGLTFERSWGNGLTVVRYINDMVTDSIERPAIHPGTHASTSVDSSKCVRHLDFNLDSKMKDAIVKAKVRFDDLTGALEKNLMEYKRFNKSYVKGKKLSPDSMMQLAFQMAYYKISSGKCAATYEPCSTSAFKHGRTETVRSATLATRKACETIFNSSASVGEMSATLQDCSKMHVQLIKEAAMGQGFDRHLLALHKIAEQSGTMPSLFADPHYELINHTILLTSTLNSPVIEYAGCAPGVPNGFVIGELFLGKCFCDEGVTERWPLFTHREKNLRSNMHVAKIPYPKNVSFVRSAEGYIIEDKRLFFSTTTYKPHQNCNDMIAALEESLNTIHDVLEGKRPS